jgi:hypothetical protein
MSLLDTACGRFRLTLPHAIGFALHFRPTDASNVRHPERWQSGRMCVIGNHVYPQGYRGFESLPLRHLTRVNDAS